MADTKMAAMFLSVFVTCLLLNVAVSQPDTTVCRPTDYTPGTNEPVKPILPVNYDVGIECNIQNRKFTAFYHEFYDLDGKRTAVHINTDNFKTSEIFSFKTNELFSINGDTNVCNVQNLTSANDLYLFGTKSASGTKAQIFTANGALQFGRNISEKWIKKTTIRGIQCNQWRSCVYWPDKKATMTVDWYFSVPGWKTTENITSVPVRAYVAGNIQERNGPRPFKHTYEFSDFRSSVRKLTVFETPSGVYCPHRKVTKPLPTPPRQFHFTSEMLKPDMLQISRIKQWYNLDMNLVWYEYQPFMSTEPYGLDLQTQVHDFNTGVAYVIDNARGNCSVTAIKSSGFDVRNTDSTHVRLRTASEFFSFNMSSYTYEGTKSARGILCDVWILQRNDWPVAGPNATTSTWQWFFATSNYNENFPDRPKFGLPVMMTLRGAQDYTYNIYGYDELQPQVWSYDVSTCYNSTAKKDFKFYLPGSYRDLASTNIDSLKYAVIKALQMTIPGLSVLRINNIQIDYADNNDIIIQFTLLDKAPVPGDVVNPQLQVDLKTAVGNITRAINGGYFVVKLQISTTGNFTSITAKPYSTVTDHTRVKYVYIKPAKSSSSGFSGGAMAGLAVGMLVAFFAIGVGIMYIYYRKLGGAFLPKKFDNTDITQDTS